MTKQMKNNALPLCCLQFYQQLSLKKSKSVEEIDKQTATKTTITTTYHKPNGSASTFLATYCFMTDIC
jgi:hypothetical protein